MSYPGGKGGPGVWQRLISLMPLHRVYIEAFAGGASVLLHKRPAEYSIAIDRDAGQIAALGRNRQIQRWRQPIELIRGDAIEWLAPPRLLGSRDLVYCDPPYLLSARKCMNPLYSFELTDDDHRRLLGVLKRLPCMVMISGYPSALYEEVLSGWRRVSFTAGTRRGKATEVVWMNYPEPVALHDYRWIGEGFRERERIRRKMRRWMERVRRLPALERAAIVSAIYDLVGSLEMASVDRVSPEVANGAGANRRKWRSVGARSGWALGALPAGAKIGLDITGVGSTFPGERLVVRVGL